MVDIDITVTRDNRVQLLHTTSDDDRAGRRGFILDPEEADDLARQVAAAADEAKTREAHSDT